MIFSARFASLSLSSSTRTDSFFLCLLSFLEDKMAALIGVDCQRTLNPVLGLLCSSERTVEVTVHGAVYVEVEGSTLT